MLDMVRPNAILEAHGVRQAFPKPSGGSLVVLDNVDLTLREGEIVGLLGTLGLRQVDAAADRGRPDWPVRRRG